MNVGELEMRKVEVSSICISLEREREKKKAYPDGRSASWR